MCSVDYNYVIFRKDRSLIKSSKICYKKEYLMVCNGLRFLYNELYDFFVKVRV